MNTYETKHLDIETNFDFDHVNENWSRPRITLKKKLAENLWLKVFLMIRSHSEDRGIMSSLYLNDRLVVKAINNYDQPVDTVNLASDEMKELVHVNDEPDYFCVEDYIEDSILPQLRNI